ncbi:hypothetical protein Q3G72_002895 [Acer saccharum]|nr:hypothetical protein Q3G72_002895 [Acer saccharum]
METQCTMHPTALQNPAACFPVLLGMENTTVDVGREESQYKDTELKRNALSMYSAVDKLSSRSSHSLNSKKVSAYYYDFSNFISHRKYVTWLPLQDI